MVSSLTLRPALDSLSVGPKDQKPSAVCYGLNVCCKWSPHYVILSLLKRKTVTVYFSTRTRGSKPSSSSLFKLLLPHQFTMVLYLTGNYGFWYCSRDSLLGKSSKTIRHIQDTWELAKYDENPMTHVHFNPKRTQGITLRPRPVRVLLPLCGSDLKSVVWWRGVSPKILVIIKLLSPGLLGGTVASLWKLRSIETCMA